MTIRDIHLANLEILIKRFGSLDKLLDAIAHAGEEPPSKKYIQQVQKGWKGRKYNNPRDLGVCVCRRIEKGIQEKEGWMDVAHAPDAPSGSMETHTAPYISPSSVRPSAFSKGDIVAVSESHVGASYPIGQWFPREDPVPDGYIIVDAVDLKVGMSSRLVIVERPDISVHLYASEFIQSRYANLANWRAYQVTGQDMEPFLFAGDWMIVDTSFREPPRQNVTDPRLCTFIFRYFDEIMVKKLHRLPGGGFLISSVNSTDNPPLEVRLDDVEHLEIYGVYMDRLGGHLSKNWPVDRSDLPKI